MKEKVVAIIGPTAVGKSKIGIELAKRLNGEIISGDSMQVYRGMDIGTAKVTAEEMEQIPHYLIDIKDPDESFSAAEFQQLAKTYISNINKKQKLPIIVGGTGLYIQSVLYDYNFSVSDSDESFREKMEEEAAVYGNEHLYAKLKEIDPIQAASIHPNNVRRVIRALEIYHVTGKKMSELQSQELKQSPYQYVLIGLTMERKKLYERINQRVDIMEQQGLLEEVESLYNSGKLGAQAAQGIGYKEIISYIENKISKEEAFEQIKQNSRRYAKRQLTWFRNKMDVTWFDMTALDYDQKVQEILSFLAGKLHEKAK